MDISVRNLTQDEVDAFYRNLFVNQVMEYIANGRTAKFIAKKTHTNLVQIKKEASGYSFECGTNNFFTYHTSQLLFFIEELYEKTEITALHGEIEVKPVHMTANE